MTVTASKIREMYIEYNKLYFENVLFMPKISTYIGDTSMGLFIVKKQKTFVEEEISIARNFKLTREELRDLVLHEMIHQFVYETYGKMNHGREFKRKMNELNNTYGFDIRKNSKHLFKKYRKKETFLKRLFSFFKS